MKTMLLPYNAAELSAILPTICFILANLSSPLKKIAGKSTAGPWAVFESGFNVTSNDIATHSKREERFQASSTPQTRDRAIVKHGLVSLTHLIIHFET